MSRAEPEPEPLMERHNAEQIREESGIAKCVHNHLLSPELENSGHCVYRS